MADWKYCEHAEAGHLNKIGKVKYAFRSDQGSRWLLRARQRKHTAATHMELTLEKSEAGPDYEVDTFWFKFAHDAGEPATGTKLLASQATFESKKPVHRIVVQICDNPAGKYHRITQEEQPDLPFWNEWSGE